YRLAGAGKYRHSRRRRRVLPINHTVWHHYRIFGDHAVYDLARWRYYSIRRFDRAFFASQPLPELDFSAARRERRGADRHRGWHQLRSSRLQGSTYLSVLLWHSAPIVAQDRGGGFVRR